MASFCENDDRFDQGAGGSGQTILDQIDEETFLRGTGLGVHEPRSLQGNQRISQHGEVSIQ